MSNRSSTSRRVIRTRVFALLAGGVVLGLGATATLASWTDTEWVLGGASGTTPGIGTGLFEVEQNTGSGWTNDLASPGGVLSFTTGALTLSPGDVTYAQVSLRTTTTTTVGGEMDLAAAVPAPGVAVSVDSTDLWNALQLRAVVSETTGAGATPACGAARFTATPTWVVGGAATYDVMGAAGTYTADLTGAAGNTFHYCFEITLPGSAASNDVLQGETIAPLWHFESESD